MASSNFGTQSDVPDLPSYLFRAFIRRVDRIRRKQLTQVGDTPIPMLGLQLVIIHAMNRNASRPASHICRWSRRGYFFAQV
jgi:hypothetical protein